MPSEIHTADSIAASLRPITCAVRWTSKRSTTSITPIADTSATHAHHPTSKSANCDASTADSTCTRRVLPSRAVVVPRGAGTRRRKCYDMRAVLFSEFKTFPTIEEVEIPEPGPGEVLLKVA